MRIIKTHFGHFEVKKKRGSALLGTSCLRSSKDEEAGANVEKRMLPVYSLDFQPNSYRLATAGGDSCVKIWDTNLLLNKSQAKISDESLQSDSLLATLTTHTKSVNIVRWSKDGHHLASGSDDNYILIYKHTPGQASNQSFGSQTVANKESWSRCFTLQGHTMDILDLDW